MKIKHHSLTIPSSNPFVNCKLDRKKYAMALTDIVNTYADGFVLAVNNEWGAGKTTFVQMWQRHLENENFQTIYFNAWENDFDSNPLVAIMSELETLSNKKNEKVFKSVVAKGAVLVKNVAPAILKAIANKYIDTKEIVEAIENMTKGATEILEEEIKAYATKKKTIQEFRNELEKFIQKSGNEKPLIFIIDELDRCRPNYAVEVLEQMKHFFSVPGIVFVLSIDKNHLASSIKGVYGSEHINTDEYLRRFIDIEYSIPQPSTAKFCEYLFEYYGFNNFFYSDRRKKISVFHRDGNTFLNMAIQIFSANNITLRQQEKIFAHVRLSLNTFGSNYYIFPEIYLLLTFLKLFNSGLYRKIENNSINIQDLSNYFRDKIKPILLEPINILYIEAMLLHLYNNNQRDSGGRMRLYDLESNGKYSTIIIDNSTTTYRPRYDLAEVLYQIDQNFAYSDTQLNYLVNKINLAEPFVNTKD